MNIKERWKDTDFLTQNLTLKDVEDLLGHITPWLEDMEFKFSWDYSVNDMKLHSFMNSTISKMYEIVNGEYKNEYELYPKQLDWELVRDKILEISKDVLY